MAIRLWGSRLPKADPILPGAKPGATGRARAVVPFKRRVLAVVMSLLAAFTLVSARLFVWPAIGAPPRVDAIIMLAGPGNRLPVAVALARAHRAPVLVISRGWQGYGGPCPAPVPGVRLICFDPDPGNTRGEAEYTARLATANHWTSVLLVTARQQDTRARMVMRRCYTGAIYVATAALPPDRWPYEIAYEWGALIKALVLHPGC